ncbi:hypothetical protein CLU79DRAFT_743991 [Phycomyces nitens]|nr:hypothetical protein CLU79DRAFT_743991 [Phycomyces nitens]
MTSTAVRVALRVRPLTQKERLSNCSECLAFIPDEPQILIGTDKSFTYDYVFDSNINQTQVYSKAAAPLLHKFVDGFNATILAYGQTGSGKTYSMGTGLENGADPENEGIVPRCIIDLYQSLQDRAAKEPDFSYQVFVSFLELYNEELIDLLNPHTSQKKKSGQPAPNTEVLIREDPSGHIYCSGVREERCESPDELLSFLAKGSLCRTTGSTEMNTVSSRSHAIFSVILKQQRQEVDGDSKSLKSLTSKFHFVDLAGSERLKRTNAQGDRAKEGIAINSGLLTLGNVISALGDETRRAAHVPYRDSKLTRLLQDSLGGNSQTMMMACVSPADTNFMETLNTLKYANRARNIKNRVSVNQEFAGSSIEVNQLRALVGRLRMEIAGLRQDGATEVYSAHPRDDDSKALRAEVVRLRERIEDLSNNMIQVTSERDTLRMERDLGEFIANEEGSMLTDNLGFLARQDRIKTHPIIEEYQKTIQNLTNELADTRDRLALAEAKPAIARVATLLPSVSATLSTISQLKTLPEMSASSQKRKKHRRRRPAGRLSTNSSSATNTARPSRISKVVSVKRSVMTATPVAAAAGRPDTSMSEYVDEDEDEGYVNDIGDEDVRSEVKESIAKARAEIRKGMEVLELIRPLEETTEAWEEELRVFEAEEERMYANAGLCRPTMDEGNFSASPSPVDRPESTDQELLDEINALAVPTWEEAASNQERRVSTPQLDGRSDRGSSVFSSMGSRCSMRGLLETKHNPQLARMLHQIQSDIKVKEDLVSHLEKSENEYSFMRRKFDDKITKLQSQLVEIQKERDVALMRTKSGHATKTDLNTQVREKQLVIDIRQAYEAKTKNLLNEIQDLKRKYAATTANMQATRNQNEGLMRSLKANVDTLILEKKRMVKRMKQETERVREQMSLQERKIQILQRQQLESNTSRRRLEREHEVQKQTLKKRSEEVLVNADQLKQLTNMLKKAVREGGILDERLLSRVSHIMGGNFAVLARGGHGFPRKTGRKKVNPIPLATRATRKKQLLDRALYQYIQGKQAVFEMEQLLIRRERLAEERVALIEERKSVYFSEKLRAENTGEPVDLSAIEFTDDRIESISAEIAYLSARIRSLQSEAAGGESGDHDNDDDDIDLTRMVHTTRPERRRVTFADEIVTEPQPSDEWADMDAFEEQYSVSNNAAPEMAYEITTKILKSLEPDECKRIAENLVSDIMDLRMSEGNLQVTMKNLEKTSQDLRRTLVVMKRAAITTTVENERRIRKLEEGRSSSRGLNLDEQNSAIDAKIEEYINSGDTIFDKIYEDGIRGMISTPEPDMNFPCSSHASPASSVGSLHEDMLITPPSPRTSPSYAMYRSAGCPASVMKPPSPLVGVINRDLAGREVTPSPDRFLNMIQKRVWQQEQQGRNGSESPIPITVVNSAEFSRYTTDRDSSTSSIRSSHLRRSSVQSDYSSSQSQHSWNHTASSTMQGSLRKRSHSLQQLQQQALHQAQLQLQAQPPQQARRRASLRELSLVGAQVSNNGAIPNTSNNNINSRDVAEQDAYDYYIHNQPPQLPSSPLATYSQQPLQRPTSKRAQQSQSPHVGSMSSMDRISTPTGGNVFARLSQTPTRASRAKVAHRHSSGSVDDLKRRWDIELQRTVSSLSDTY